MENFKEILIGAYATITWGAAAWYKQVKKPKDFPWKMVVAAPFLVFIIAPILLFAAVFYNLYKTSKSPLSFLLLAISQAVFVIPSMPARIRGPLGTENVPDAVAMVWGHGEQYIVVAASLVLFLVIYWLKPRHAQKKVSTSVYLIPALLLALAGTLLVDIMIAQIATSWWTIAATIGAFVGGFFLEEARRRYWPAVQPSQ